MDFINKIIENIIKVFDKQYDRRKSIQFLFVTVICLIIGTIIYGYFSYDSRISIRIDNLEKLSELNIEYIEEHDVLEDEYDKIIHSLENRSVIERVDFSDLEFFNFDAGSRWLKFITGAGLWFAFVILTPFIYKSLGEVTKAIVVFIVLGFVFGGVALLIPIILLPIVNYVLIPCLEVLFIYWIAKFSKKKNNPE